MPCEVCGKPSGKYPLCKECFEKREKGEIIKCEKCHRWHPVNVTCSGEIISAEDTNYLYAPKHSLLTKSEFAYYKCIKDVLPPQYFLHVQANLASFIRKTDCSHYQNELYRNVDFLITDLNYKPLAVIEINDQTHLSKERYGRDEKVAKICEEAGIPIIKLWTSYGINPEYIEKRIKETLSSLPVKRVHHFKLEDKKDEEYEPFVEEKYNRRRKHRRKGCYVATCVYGSYDCPEVWVLRRFRDNILANNFFGKIFINIYYVVSPTFVKVFGNFKPIKKFIKKSLDKFVESLKAKGFEDTKYYD